MVNSVYHLLLPQSPTLLQPSTEYGRGGGVRPDPRVRRLVETLFNLFMIDFCRNTAVRSRDTYQSCVGVSCGMARFVWTNAHGLVLPRRERRRHSRHRVIVLLLLAAPTTAGAVSVHWVRILVEPATALSTTAPG